MTVKRFWILAFSLLFATALVADIPFFWLDKPTGRTNPHDPMSPLYVQPTSLPIAPFGTPTATPTISPTHTQSPTFTISPTLSPTPSVVHGSMVSDAENGLNPAWTGGPGGIYVTLDGYGSTALPDPFGTSAGGSDLIYGSAGNAFCMNGNLLPEVAATSQWSFAGFHIELAFGALTASEPGVDVGPYSPENSLSFSFRSNIPGVPYRVELITDDVADFGYYRYIFSPGDTAWNSYTVYFPDGVGVPKLAQPSWAIPQPWAIQKQKVKGISFQVYPLTSAQAYDFCVDDISFEKPQIASPTASPTATQTSTPTMVVFSTSTGVPLMTSTFTRTQTPSRTPSPTHTATSSYSLTPTPSQSSTSSATPSASPTPTPVLTPTETPTPVLPAIWYDGESPGAMLSDVTLVDMKGNTSADLFSSAEQATGGYSGANFLRSSMNLVAGSYFGALKVQRPAADLSTRNVIEISYRIPSSSTSDLNLGVQLIGSGTAPNDQSVVVSMTAYVNTGSVEVKGQWQTVTIPLEAFIGDNGQGGVFGVGDLAVVTGVQVRPMPRNFNAGALQGEFDLDSIRFANLGSPPSVRTDGIGHILEDGSSPLGLGWTHAYWFHFMDSHTCALPVSNRVFPVGATDPPVVALGSTDSPGGSIGYEGTFGAANPEPAPANPCNPDGLSWTGDEMGSYVGLGLSMVGNAIPTPRNLTLTAGVTSFTGLKLKISLGPGHDAANLRVNFVRVATGSGISGQDYYALIPSSGLNSSFTEVTLPFPAAGANSVHPVTLPVRWGQPAWATQVPFGWADVISLTFAPDVDTERGKDFQFYVDDIVLY